MVNNILPKEVCACCARYINIGQAIIECCICNKVIHTNCFRQSDLCIENSLYRCRTCIKSIENRYNPFKHLSVDDDANNFYDEDPNSLLDSIQVASNILAQCESYSTQKVTSIYQSLKGSVFSSYFLNIDGNNTNFDSLVVELSMFQFQFSAIGVAETNTEPELGQLFQLSNYCSFYQDTAPGKAKGTGVALYLLNSFNATVMKHVSHTTLNLETIFVTISNTDRPITVGVVYRPPSANDDESIAELRCILALLPKNPTYIMGDFNINLFAEDKKFREFEDLILTEAFLPLISTYTHHRPNCSKTCIDNILTNNAEDVLHSGTIENKLSHHLPIFQFSSINTPKSQPEKIKQYYDYSNSNLEKFTETLSYTLLSYNPQDFSQFLSVYQSSLDSTCKLATPKFSKRNHNNNPWITTSIVESVKTKELLYGDWKDTCTVEDPEGDRELHDKYSAYRYTLKHIIKYARNKFYGKKLEEHKGNSKKTWRIINQLRGKTKRSMKPQFIIDNKRIIERRVIANAFNSYFTNIAFNMNNTIGELGLPIIDIISFKNFMPQSNPNSIFLNECTAAEIEEIIEKYENGKASDIPVTVIKRSSRIISPHLEMHYNNLMKAGIFPDELKTAKVTPIYKKGNEEHLENYRPVSILPIFGKIFEKLIYSRLYSFFASQGILNDRQFGFREGHSTTHALNYSVELVRKALKKKQHVLAIFIDLSKAFDTLDHKTLLEKLDSYGIRGNTHRLLTSYLTDRFQYTSALGEKSSLLPIIYGVPQGSCLGPLLFLIYINDICNSSNLGEFVLFADDTNIFITVPNIDEAYNNANAILQHVHAYMNVNKLHINLGKCCYMHFNPFKRDTNTKKHAKHILNIQETVLDKVQETRFLGVIIDD